MRYNNYHKHTHISNIFTPDTHIKAEDYIKRVVELGHDTYFTTEHGSGGDIFEAKLLCDEYNIKCKFGVEGYIVPNAYDKDSSNYHIVLIPKTDKARKKINLITSRANEEGFYYKPRIFLEDLLKLDRNDIYITTACVGGILRDLTSIEKILIPLIENFGDNVLLEVQTHKDMSQIQINKKCIELSNKFNLKLIAANDSHYIYESMSKDRLDFLKGKGINYGDEDTYVLDYPDADTMYNRFKEQGVLDDNQINEAISNTLLFDECEEIKLDKEIKMPTIYPGLSSDEKISLLKERVAANFKEIIKNESLNEEEVRCRARGIVDEMKVIEDTKEINTADYFLFNERNVDLAVNKYGGILTRTGRGSSGSYYINKMLGMTQMDRFDLEIKLYPERFMSTARLLENRALPDIDYNVADPEPFVKASRELLGQHGCYPMIAYGTMQESEAFRNECRTRGFEHYEYNEISKKTDAIDEHSRWWDVLESSKKYVNSVVSASIHPCAYLLDNKDLREEYGVVKIGDNLCVMITSKEADEFKCLKNDYLTVSVWKLISETYKLIGVPIDSIKGITSKLDDKVWGMYEYGLTCTLNQVDSDWASDLVKNYKPKTISEISMFTACLRPFFDAWRSKFINRVNYSTDSKYLDILLKSTNHYILFQENLMQFFEWLSITPAESIGLIKKISKKEIRKEDFAKLEERIKRQWIENTGSIDEFDHVWKNVQDCMEYGFCSAHAVATGIDSLYGAYLKSHYPLQYYTVVLNEYSDDTYRTSKLTDELKFFGIKLKPIKFGFSVGKYSFNKEKNEIYKGISSIKYMNETIGNELLEISKRKHQSFIELLDDIKINTSVNSRQLDILIVLNFFSDYGNNKYLQDIVNIYKNFRYIKIINKSKLEDMNLSEYIAKSYSNKETKSQFRELDNVGIINYYISKLNNEKLNVIDQIKMEYEFTGSSDYKNEKFDEDIYIVVEFDEKNTNRPKIIVKNIKSGEIIKTRIKRAKNYIENPFGCWAILRFRFLDEESKVTRNSDGEWISLEEKELILNEFMVIKGGNDK